MDNIETGRRIRQYRKLKGYTQAELAQKIGVSTMSVRRYESGERIITMAMVKKIAAVLDVTAETIFPVQVDTEGIAALGTYVNAGEIFMAGLSEADKDLVFQLIERLRQGANTPESGEKP